MQQDQHKLTVSIPTELFLELKGVVPWGLKRHLVIAIVRLIIDAVRRDGVLLIGAIMEGEYKLVPRQPEDQS